ncbi:bacterioferritin [Basilea psittacipulmonis]|uniref:Bacterioferritin n=1 Tax=Basilea psittacipulmonis DSM 24701 TaxID=1072685 RepID=A0A077DBR0_9BURK|nr:bacterioferritin [Basilea psittacipulmonis]AIL32099.1 bacterioferritin [Basilea psittacipulmonis DSM 24701]
MQGNKEVLDCLNKLLAGELAARDQYFIHSRMYEEWHYTKLAARIGHEVDDETSHASDIIKRMLMLGGTPNMTPAPIKVGTCPKTMLEADLEVEYEVRTNLQDAIALCESKKDYVTRDILLKQLIDTEIDHAHWLEQQLGLIEKMGIQNYLQSMAQ